MNDDKDEDKLKRGQRERLNRSPLSTIESSVSNPLAAENGTANKNKKTKELIEIRGREIDFLLLLISAF